MYKFVDVSVLSNVFNIEMIGSSVPLARFTILVSTMFLFNWESTKGISYYILYTRFVVDRKVEVGRFIYPTLTCGIHL